MTDTNDEHKRYIQTNALDDNDNFSGTTQTPTSHPSFNFDKEFAAHRLAIAQGNVEKAIQSFILLQSNSEDSEKYNNYVIELSNHIDPIQDSDSSRFFQSLPALIQSTIVNTASAYLEKISYLKAYQILFDYIQAYPRHAYKYLIRTMKLLILGAQGDDKDKCIHILVTNLFPRLWKQRILLTNSGCTPTIKSTDGKHYIIIPCNLFEEFLRLGQRYYIDHRRWNDIIKFTCSMLDCCGYEGLARLDFLSHTNRFQYLKEQRHSLQVIQNDAVQQQQQQQQSAAREDETSPSTSFASRSITTKTPSSPTSTSATSVLGINADKDTLLTVVAFMCEFMAVSSQFTQFAYDYYRAICVLDSSSPSSSSSSSSDTSDTTSGGGQRQEKSCLIPICAIQSSNQLVGEHWKKPTTKTATTTSSRQAPTSNPTLSSSTSTTTLNENQYQDNDHQHQTKKSKQMDHIYEDELDSGNSKGSDGLNSDCMMGVDQTLQILSKAADCLRHLVNLWDWATHKAPDIHWTSLFGSWEIEFNRVIDAYQLPFDIYNAILLVRSDLALSTPSIPGNLSKALKLSQSICDRIEAQRRQGKDKSHLIEYNIPFMFAFRVLYTIGVIYLLVGSLQQSTLEIAIILSVFPIPQELNAEDFVTDEIDCHTAATVFRDHEYGLMHVTQRGLVVRCIKHLIVSLDSETGQQGGMASLDSAMRWDEKAGSMMVLMQYGWPYWNTRTDFWDKVIQQMKERRIFRNRSVLEYIFVPEILHILKCLHESKQVGLDILSAEFIIRNGHHRLETQSPSTSPRFTATKNSDDRTLPSLSSLPISSKSVIRPPPPMYEPTMTNTILPSMEMSPSWYSVSTQNASQVNWMSPSFYYSRPATSVVLPATRKKRTASQMGGNGDGSDDHDNDSESRQAEKGGDSGGGGDGDGDHAMDATTNVLEKRHFISDEMISKYLDQRIERFSRNKISPQRIRHVLQLFLKNMVVKGSEDE
ncbi:hypothetical protein BCR42DRAFT_482563 [Absidia repens]|uniref:Integrator complex subunit 10 n=1 Tax=Absidia repens TaxID=90262 RepID=A0A1X2IGM7_9FUNG|nr:hypothetical protein BCR42DRAFT_482563 [Absidia repens]